MHLSIYTLVAVASATAHLLPERQTTGYFPTVQILPVPGYNSTNNGFSSLGTLYLGNAAQLASQAESIAQANTGLNYQIAAAYNFDAKANLTRALANVTNTFWQVAYKSEMQVCSITTSINEQNFDAAVVTLRAGLIAEISAVTNVTIAVQKTVANIQNQLITFTDAEKALIGAAIQAVASAVVASVGPASILSAGLTSAGLTGLVDVVQALQVAAGSLQTVAQISWRT